MPQLIHMCVCCRLRERQEGFWKRKGSQLRGAWMKTEGVGVGAGGVREKEEEKGRRRIEKSGTLS